MKDNEVTIYDIAKMLNVSATTVSRGMKDHPTISKKTKKRIWDLVEKLGYRSNTFAKNLRSTRTNTIGIILPQVNNYLQYTVLSRIIQVLKENGFTLIIDQTLESLLEETASAKRMFEIRVDGLILFPTIYTENTLHLEGYTKKKIPIIIVDRMLQQDKYVSVVIDNRKAAYIGTKHLIDQGRKNIIYISGFLQTKAYLDRALGYKDALLDAGLLHSAENVIVTNLTFEDGVRIVEELIMKEQVFDGMFVGDDKCAVGCIAAMKRANIKIPEDVSVIGFNDDPISVVIEPNLTTIKYPAKEMGDTIANQIINSINGTFPNSSTESLVLRSELVIRRSSIWQEM